MPADSLKKLAWRYGVAKKDSLAEQAALRNLHAALAGVTLPAPLPEPRQMVGNCPQCRNNEYSYDASDKPFCTWCGAPWRMP